MLFPYEIAKKTRFSKRTRIEAPFGARWIWIFFLCQYRGWRKQAKEARRLDKKSAHLEIVVRDVAPPGLLRTFSSSLGYQKSWEWAAGLRQNSWARDSQLMTLTSACLNLYTWKYMNMFLTSFLAQLHTGFAATVETPMASITAGSRSHECFVKPQFSNQFSVLKSCLKYAVP